MSVLSARHAVCPGSCHSCRWTGGLRDDADIVHANRHAPRESVHAHGLSTLTRDTGFDAAEKNGKPSSLLDSHRSVTSVELTETNEPFRESIRLQQQLVNWLHFAADRLGEAQNERIRAVVEAFQSGFSVSSIAATTRLNTDRAEQNLGSKAKPGAVRAAPAATPAVPPAQSGTPNEFSSDVSKAKRPGKPKSHAGPGHLTGQSTCRSTPGHAAERPAKGGVPAGYFSGSLTGH